MTLIEKMARAICRAEYMRQHMLGLTVTAAEVGFYVDKRWSEKESAAIAALTAAREPSEGMVEAMRVVANASIQPDISDWYAEKIEADDHFAAVSVLPAWQAGINAALKEQG